MSNLNQNSWDLNDLVKVAAGLTMDITHATSTCRFSRVVPVETDDAEGLAIASSAEQIRTALACPKAVIVVPLSALASPLLASQLHRLVGCSNPGILWARALRSFHPHGKDPQPSVHKHATTVIDPTASIDPTAWIEAHAIIGANVKIEAYAWIGPHCVIENNAVIGASTRLHSHVAVGPRTVIGSRVEIKPSTVVGSAGFGFSHDDTGQHHHIPQVGRVVIEDDVFIGSLCNIDRATTGETRIGMGTKIDSMVHIGHNCIIGRHTILTGTVAIAGSTTVGDHCVFGGRSTISDHVRIADRVHLAGLSGVTKDIPNAGAYGGFPIQPIQDALRSAISIAKLPQIRKQIARILKHLELTETE